MAGCKFCGNPVEDGVYDGSMHGACNDEYWRRRMNDTCIHCGKQPITREVLCCRDCTDESEYLDYPGA